MGWQDWGAKSIDQRAKEDKERMGWKDRVWRWAKIDFGNKAEWFGNVRRGYEGTEAFECWDGKRKRSSWEVAKEELEDIGTYNKEYLWIRKHYQWTKRCRWKQRAPS